MSSQNGLVPMRHSVDYAQLFKTLCFLTCDGELIRRVLENLIHNALKFTPEDGSIHVAVSRISDALRIEVRDTGPGIPPSIEQRSLINFGRPRLSRRRIRQVWGWPFVVWPWRLITAGSV